MCIRDSYKSFHVVTAGAIIATILARRFGGIEYLVQFEDRHKTLHRAGLPLLVVPPWVSELEYPDLGLWLVVHACRQARISIASTKGDWV